MWYAIHDTDTGRLRSLGTVLPGMLPAGLTVLELGDTRPDMDGLMWDAATRALVARPAPALLIDRLDDIQDAPAFLELRAAIAGISNASQRTALTTALRTCLIRFIGRHRWRKASEPVAID